jgi:signal transduction histidine kinase
VRDLRPTALDDHGLTGALREFALRLGDAVRFDLDLPPQDATLPAAVEIATYRITTEALTNVVRHAGASNCRVRLVIGEHVDIDVTDDGVGLAHPRPSGMGLQAMHERVTALGGTLDVTCVAPHGTRVHARLPVEVARP